MRFRTFSILNIVFLFTVYCAFFVVQVLFNIGAYTTSPHEMAAKVFFSKSNTKNIKNVCETNAGKIVKKNILLNKRFQPASLPALTYAVTAPAPLTLSPEFQSNPVSHLLISSILADSLRGPPVA